MGRVLFIQIVKNLSNVMISWLKKNIVIRNMILIMLRREAVLLAADSCPTVHM